ncbi:Pls/PosA family non-ribosomal peptide synthetase, partial [Ilumatobacter sp.]|uniref:Pls/PosA family non-ribosomal peptide synthetase n=1 Tax=Ilumatobacter sp. TaxID=1967498 RepID=UPI003AF8329E
KHPDLPSLSIKEVYQRPTIRSLATSIDGTDDETSPQPTAESPLPALEPATRVPTWQYIGCGAAQLLIAVAFASVGAVVLAGLYEWVSAADGVASTYGRAIVFSSGLMVAWSLLPIVVKWTLIGRSRPSHFPVWSFRYLRFWFVKVVINANPMAAFVGTPIFVLYLRALGADIGSGALILSRQIPVDTDLLTIGDHAVVRKDSSWSCYRAHAGWIQTGPVSVGRGAVVGESTVLDIYTSLGDGAQLGHASALCAGQSVPDGEFRQGAPAVRRTDANLRSAPPIESGTTRRRVVYSSIQLFVLLFVTGPVVLGGITAVAEWRIASPDFLGTDATTSVWAFNRNALIISFVLYFGLLVVGLAVACIVPRMLARLVRPGEVYPLYGIRYWAHRTITRLTNVPVFTNLFGDSSYILHYLYCLGYDVSFSGQTGANFGLNVKHDHPYSVTVGSGTMAADGLSIVNAEYSSTSFGVSSAEIGSHSFIGNQVVFPSKATTGDDCLLASKVLVPVDGDRREHVGFLGSPNFEIPRKVERDRKFDDLGRGDEFARGLAAKNRHNLVSMALYLLSRWVMTFAGVLAALGAIDLSARFGAPAIVVELVLLTVFVTLFYVFVEHASTGFRSLRPVYCSLYEPANWQIERFWKLSWQPALFNGTPFKNLIWRLMGVRIGRRVFDDGCVMTEKTMITVGDDCTLNAGSVIQPHSQEDGALKSDYVAVGDGCTLGIRSLVHYGVTMGDGASLDANAFLMKGAEVAPHTHWAENPAREIGVGHSTTDATAQDTHALAS